MPVSKCGLEALEARTMLAVVEFDGGPAGTGTDFLDPINWVGDVLPGPADTANITGSGAPITVRGAKEILNLNSTRPLSINIGGNLTTSAMNSLAASVTMLGGTLTGGTYSFSGGSSLVTTQSGGTLSSVAIMGEIRLDEHDRIRVAGSTTFTATRLRGNGASLTMTSGFVLSSLVSVEGVGAGNRAITMGDGSGGTVTIGPTGTIRMVEGLGGFLDIRNDSAVSPLIINKGLISNEAAGQRLHLFPRIDNSEGTMRISAGATLAILGTLSTANLGTFINTGGEVLVSGTIDNAGRTLTLDSMTGSWRLSGGRIVGGTLAFTEGQKLLSSTEGGLLDSVTVMGEIALDFSQLLSVSGTTSFAAVRMRAAGANLFMARGFVLTSLVSVEGVDAGLRTITLIELGSGVVTVAPTGIIRVAAGSGGDLRITRNSSAALSLINNGVISNEEQGRALNISIPSFANNGTLSYVNGADGAITLLTGGFTNDGVISLSPGSVLTVNGNFAQSSSGSIGCEIGVGNTFGRLAVTGSAALGGGATLAFVGGYTGAANGLIDFVSAAGTNGVTGAFSNAALPLVNDPGLKTSLLYQSDRVRFLITHIADFNNDGDTDATDIFIFLDSWFAQNGTSGPNLAADIDGNGTVNATDIFIFLDFWFSAP